MGERAIGAADEVINKGSYPGRLLGALAGGCSAPTLAGITANQKLDLPETWRRHRRALRQPRRFT